VRGILDKLHCTFTGWVKTLDIYFSDQVRGILDKLHCTFTGWVKTLDTYFNDQVRGILDNMVIKLEAYPKMKFMFAEMSFFSMWWNQIDQYKKNKVKK
jgi:hypothetical protein